MTDMQPTSDRQQKQERIRELRDAISQLESELERDLQRDQHEAIDHLEDYFVMVDSKFDNLKLLWETLKSELKRKFRKD